MTSRATTLAVTLLACNASRPAVRLTSSTTTAPGAAAVSSAAPSAMVATPPGSVAAASPTAPTCDATTTLPSRESENVALVAALAVNVSTGLTLGSCAAMVKRDDTGPADLYGRPTRVACGPPRLCSDGPDGRRSTPDDVCSPLDAKLAGPGLGLRNSAKNNRFLAIDPEARPGCAAADAAIVHFFASLLRDDDAFNAVLPPPAGRTEMLRAKLEKIAGFRVHAARLDDLQCSERICRFRVWLDVTRRDAEPGAPHQTGVDSGEVELLDGKWSMTRPPS